MKRQLHLLALSTALLFAANGLLSQTTGGTTTDTTTTDTTTTGGTTTGGTTTGGETTGGTTTGGETTGGTTTGGETTGGTTTGTDTTGTDTTGGGRKTPHTPNPKASEVSQAVQTILQKFDANRDQFAAERKELIEKLQAAKTEEERKAIRAQLKAELQAEKAQRTQLGKEIRDELRKLREERKNGGG